MTALGHQRCHEKPYRGRVNGRTRKGNIYSDTTRHKVREGARYSKGIVVFLVKTITKAVGLPNRGFFCGKIPFIQKNFIE